MKLLFLIDSLDGGGAEKVLTDIVNSINLQKFEIDLFLLRNKGVYLDKIPKEINIKYIYNDKNYMKNKLLYKAFFAVTKTHLKINKILGLERLFKKHIKKEYDTYIAFLEGTCVQFISDANVNGKKIAWIHTELSKHIIMNSTKEQEILSNMDEIVCVSDTAKISLVEKHPSVKDKVKVIYNPLNTELIINKAKEAAEENITSDVPVFISMGRLKHVKGYDLLLEAHKQLIEDGIKHKVYILGEGPEGKMLNEKIIQYKLQDTFKILGFKENPYKYIKQADFYIMTSRYEGYCLSMIEAVILDKPVVSTDFDSALQIIKKNNLGLVAKREDVTDIKENMKRMIEDKAQQEVFKKNCKEYKETLDFKKQIARIETILSNKK